MFVLAATSYHKLSGTKRFSEEKMAASQADEEFCEENFGI